MKITKILKIILEYFLLKNVEKTGFSYFTCSRRLVKATKYVQYLAFSENNSFSFFYEKNLEIHETTLLMKRS